MVRSKSRDSLTYKRSVLYSNLHPPGYQSETIAFTPTKMHPLTAQRVHCIKIGVFSQNEKNVQASGSNRKGRNDYSFA